jgi:carboxymethylenebutenolidase
MQDGILRRSVDKAKDQSYVLAVLRADQLAHSMFPLGTMTKQEVRAEATRRGFAVAAKPDSYDICFIPDGDTHGYLVEKLGARTGSVVDSESGEVLGEHDGAFAFTIGQRKGLKLQRPAADERLRGEFVELPSPSGNGKLRGYLVRPKTPSGKLPAVLVVHENRGLNPHIEDVARRLALQNFLVFAPDALFTLGGYPGDEDKARELFQKLDQSKTLEDFVTSEKYLRAHAEGNGRVGVVGFCYGGGIAHTLATRLPDLDAAVPFYGVSPAPELARQVKAELLVHLAATDERVNTSFPPYETALKAAKVKFAAHTYPGTQHGFHNDTTPRYDETAAKLAWSRTLELFERKLRKPKSSPHAAHKPER